MTRTKRQWRRAERTWHLPGLRLPILATWAMLGVTAAVVFGRGLFEHPRRISAWVDLPPQPRWRFRREPPFESSARELLVDAWPEDHFVLEWREDPDDIRRVEVPKRVATVTWGNARSVTYPGLGSALAEEWKEHGLYTDPVDVRKQPLVLRFSNDEPLSALVGLLDAIHAVTRPSPSGGPPESVFDVTLSAR